METNAKTLRNTVAYCRISMYESLLLRKSYGKHLRIRSRRCTFVRLMSKRTHNICAYPLAQQQRAFSSLVAAHARQMNSRFRIPYCHNKRQQNVRSSVVQLYGLSVLFRSSGSVSSLKESIYYRSLAIHTTTITYPKCDFSFTSTALLLLVQGLHYYDLVLAKLSKAKVSNRVCM